MWQIPIYDRTAANVAEGADKCYLNAETLNRIEDNTAYMASLLGAKVTTRHWEATDFLTRSEMERVLQNIQAAAGHIRPARGTHDVVHRHQCHGGSAVEPARALATQQHTAIYRRDLRRASDRSDLNV